MDGAAAVESRLEARGPGAAAEDADGAAAAESPLEAHGPGAAAADGSEDADGAAAADGSEDADVFFIDRALDDTLNGSIVYVCHTL